MSFFIPSDAVSSIITPLQRQDNESVQARRTQLQKNRHHAEDIQELDDAAVDSISDHAADRDPQQNADDARESEERLDIASLKNHPGEGSGTPTKISGPIPSSHLDISA